MKKNILFSGVTIVLMGILIFSQFQLVNAFQNTVTLVTGPITSIVTPTPPITNPTYITPTPTPITPPITYPVVTPTPIIIPVTPTPTPITRTYNIFGKVIYQLNNKINLPALSTNITVTNISTNHTYIVFTNIFGYYSLKVPAGYYQISAHDNNQTRFFPVVRNVAVFTNLYNQNFQGKLTRYHW